MHIRAVPYPKTEYHHLLKDRRSHKNRLSSGGCIIRMVVRDTIRLDMKPL